MPTDPGIPCSTGGIRRSGYGRKQLFRYQGCHTRIYCSRNFPGDAYRAQLQQLYQFIIKPVTILAPVVVDFVYDHTCVNGSANFGPDAAVMNVADIAGWTWDFGDGVTNFIPYTNHVYAAPGSYRVTLTVTDISGCTASKTRTVVVNPQPVAMFNTTQIPCTDVPADFDDVSAVYAGFITKWASGVRRWKFADDTIPCFR